MNAAQHITPKQRLKRVTYFFPIILLWLHFKRNHFLLLLWILLLGLTTGFIGQKYGVLHQFLYPEYIGSSNFLSFSFIGFALGGFIMAFNLYTYILHGFRFPFIATLHRPFIKFSVNNLIIPLVYIVVFMFCSYNYQITQELLPTSTVVLNLTGFIVGLLVYLGLTWLYFNYTNKGAEEIVKRGKKESQNLIESSLHKKRNWDADDSKTPKWEVETYLYNLSTIRLARESQHYDRATLSQVFNQNHLNASLFELLLVLSFLAFGFFGESFLFAIPAGASAILFFTVVMMIISAIFSWIKGWTLTVMIFIVLGLNYWSSSSDLLQIPNHAYGLNYEVEEADVSHDAVLELLSPETIQSDHDAMIQMLENWKKKVQVYYPDGEKPKFLVVNCSGGGSRSALWTMSALLELNKAVDDNFIDQTFMINGSSGGMLGASYLRELVLLEKEGEEIDIYDTKYLENISKDLLNPVMFAMATNDMFFRFKSYEYNGHSYTKDRAFAFENQFHKNTNDVLRKNIGDYKDAEFKAQVPMMIMAPTITNDGRRLLISSQPISFLSKSLTEALPEDLEFRRLFENQDADSLAFTTALRMNATFPYILPMVSLPSKPEMLVMDAGLRDNYGLKTTFEFVSEFSDWINENTSGVLIVQTRDLPESFEKKRKASSLLRSFSEPLGSVYDNFINTQRYTNDQIYRYLKTSFESVELITLHLNNSPDQKVSLSWHLTKAEKKAIQSGLEKEEFKEKIQLIKSRLEAK